MAACLGHSASMLVTLAASAAASVAFSSIVATTEGKSSRSRGGGSNADGRAACIKGDANGDAIGEAVLIVLLRTTERQCAGSRS